MKKQFSLMALLVLLTLPLAAMADPVMPQSQANEWAGIKQILSNMGKGTISPADQQSVLDILNTKGTLEDVKTTAPSTFPATPVSPESVKKQPPRRSPSAF